MATPNHLIDYFPNYLSTNSLFTKMATLGAPWGNDVGQDMDDAYFTMYSGVKNPSQFVLLHLNPDSTTEANSLTIARILYGIYGANWTKLWEAFKAEYTPLDTYNLKETVTATRSNDRSIMHTNDITSTLDGAESETSQQDGTQSVKGTTSSTATTDSNGSNALQHGEEIQRDSEIDSFTYGFNSDVKVPTSVQMDSTTETHSGTDTTTTTDHSTSETSGTSNTDTTDSLTGTVVTTTKDTKTDKVVEDTTDLNEGKEDIERIRAGNVGQNTYQDLLRQEFELWRWNFFTQVFEDCDKFLVLSTYTHC